MTKQKFNLADSYICNDCIFVFSIHTPMKKQRGKLSKTPHCPSCGEKLGVAPLSLVVIKRQPNKNWTDEELELVDRCITGELLPYQVAYKTNRTKWSVRNKVHRRRAELGVSTQ